MSLDKRICRSCSRKIPWRVKIDGKTRVLRNRKFCLICSPFKGHNTKPDNPNRPSKGRKYKDWDELRKVQYKLILLKRGHERKQKLVEMLGGKCIKCGYNECERALAFHYKDKSEKLFPLSVEHLWAKSWKRILVEVEKCELMCVRCLSELLAKEDENKIEEYEKIVKGLSYVNSNGSRTK